jgi:hypothetical protein
VLTTGSADIIITSANAVFDSSAVDWLGDCSYNRVVRYVAREKVVSIVTKVMDSFLAMSQGTGYGDPDPEDNKSLSSNAMYGKYTNFVSNIINEKSNSIDDYTSKIRDFSMLSYQKILIKSGTEALRKLLAVKENYDRNHRFPFWDPDQGTGVKCHTSDRIFKRRGIYLSIFLSINRYIYLTKTWYYFLNRWNYYDTINGNLQREANS